MMDKVVMGEQVEGAFSEEEKETFLRALEVKLPRLFPALEGFSYPQLVMSASWILAACFAVHPEAYETHCGLLMLFAPLVEEAFEAMAKRDPEGMAKALEADLVMLPYPQAPADKVFAIDAWRQANGKPVKNPS